MVSELPIKHLAKPEQLASKLAAVSVLGASFFKRNRFSVLNARVRRIKTLLVGLSGPGHVESGGLPIALQDEDKRASISGELYGSGDLLALEPPTGGTIYSKEALVSPQEKIKPTKEIALQRGRLDGKRVTLSAGQPCSKCQRENYRLLGKVSLVSHILSPFSTSANWALSSELAILANAPIVHTGVKLIALS